MSEVSTILERDGLKMNATWAKDAATLVWSGACDMRHPNEVLEPFLKEFTKELNGRSLTIDLRSLDYMNSAAQSPILQFLKNMTQEGIATRVLYNGQREWQRISYRCVKSLFGIRHEIKHSGRMRVTTTESAIDIHGGLARACHVGDTPA